MQFEIKLNQTPLDVRVTLSPVITVTANVHIDRWAIIISIPTNT